MEVFEWGIPLDFNLFFAVLIRTLMFRFYNVSIVTIWYWVYERKSGVKFIWRFNFKNFVTEGTFD